MPPSRTTPLLVLSDLHLGRQHGRAVAHDCARLVASHPGHEVVFAGDTFELSTEPAGQEPASALTALADQYQELGRSLRQHLAQGGRVTLIAGNHDAAIIAEPARQALLRRWELTDAAPFDVEQWFVRRGSVHIEHGHLYDPDNAPAHPLALWSDRTEPLGIALTRRFLSPSGALDFAHEHELTPVAGFRLAFQRFGRRAPRLIADYFRTAIALTWEAKGKQRWLLDERSLGSNALEDFGRRSGLGGDVLEALVGAAPVPTHFDARATFMRLYFDRILAGLALSGGALGAAAGNPLGPAVALAGGLYLLMSTLGGVSRYSGVPEERLRAAAATVRAVTDAGLVIFGHTHREESSDGYINLGSFAYGTDQRRSYVTLDETGRPERKRLEGLSG